MTKKKPKSKAEFGHFSIDNGGVIVSEQVERRAGTIDALFRTLADQWKADTQFMSTVSQMAMHPCYQRIIGLGPAAIPHILRELEEEPDHWFWALFAITGENPVKERERGNLSKMTAAWFRWAKARGIRW
jgi:hypothetical protein